MREQRTLAAPDSHKTRVGKVRRTDPGFLGRRAATAPPSSHHLAVGVDEADAAKGLVAFVAPIARAILGCEVSETATLRTTRGDEVLQVMSIEYPVE